MRAYLGVFGIAVLLATVAPLLAHHSFDAEFDRAATIELTATVTKVEWMNPHVWFYGDVKAEDGSIEKWQFELGAPNSLRRNGWGPKSLNIGDQVSVSGYRAKDGTNTGNARTVTLADGKRVFAGSSAGDEKGK